ncbi:hypothetical protein VTO73DRAFT_9923 [Trametes versicolor]
MQNGPPTSSDFDDTLTKEQYHAKKRSKARRRAARARTLSNAAGEPGITKRSVKEVALKRRSAAVTLSASIDIGPEVRRVLDADNASSSAIGAEPIPTNYSLAMEDVPVTKTAFTSTRKEATEEDRREYTKEELIARGFEYVPWDGRVPRPILDQHGRVFAVLAGRPRDTGWDEVNAQLQEILETTREAYRPQPKQTNHRRGTFTAVSCGFSYGGGQTYVRNVALDPDNQGVMDSLTQQKAVQRVANFGNSAMQLFAPRLYNYYDNTIQALCSQHTHLRRNFNNNVFANATFNLGPRTVSYVHADIQNLPWGWCAITAVGDFDPVCSGVRPR